jgi:hypothetical protein
MESNMEVLQKTKKKLPYDLVTPLLGIHLKKCTPGNGRTTCTLMFIAALFTIIKIWKQPRRPTCDE